ncbi:MAG TPA: hypothetical protein VFZ12_02760, partial [Dehalococcoidia bacterium]|nr:hypothetical protein [Dehalococcoidia bacterium]
MTISSGSIAPFYEGWRQYNSRIVDALRGLTDEQLQFRATPQQMPIWAIAAHIVGGARLFWLCTVCGEEGADATPFARDARAAGMSTEQWLAYHSWEDYA